MRDLAFLVVGVVVGLVIGGALLLDEMAESRARERALRRQIDAQVPAPSDPPVIAHYSGCNSPHPKGHAVLYVEVPDSREEAWKAIGGPAS